jgi:nucleotide-binding universal stress UspA family protein
VNQIIVVPVDFSRVTSDVIAVAINVAKMDDDRVLLVHATDIPIVYEPYGLGLSAMADAIAVNERYAKRRLRQLATRVAKKFPAIEWDHAKGRPADAILNVVRGRDARFIVIGSHGHGAMYDMFVGSTTQAVLRRAPCPVIVVPDKRALRNPGRTKK